MKATHHFMAKFGRQAIRTKLAVNVDTLGGMASERNHSRISQDDKAEAGYSLLEILIALAIIGTLTALVAPRLLGHVDRSNEVSTKAQAKQLEAALTMMSMDIGRFPSPDEGLELLVSPGPDMANWKGPYLTGGLPVDAWGYPFQYAPPAPDNPYAPPRVYSLGADNAPGGDGPNADVDG